MTQFELVFRTPDGHRTKVHDATGIDEPRINEVKLVDGARLTVSRFGLDSDPERRPTGDPVRLVTR